MPIKPGHPCAHRGCPEIVRNGRFCAEHKSDGQAYDKNRGASSQRGYGSRWRRLRKMVLNANPICADPWGVHQKTGEVVLATDVDHVVPRSAGGSDELDNLQALCHQCHSKKTAAVDRGFGNPSRARGEGDVKSLGPDHKRPRGEQNFRDREIGGGG